MNKHLLLSVLLATVFSCAEPETTKTEPLNTITAEDAQTIPSYVSGTSTANRKKLQESSEGQVAKGDQARAVAGLEGMWVHESDSLAYLDISGTSWILGYEGQEVKQDDKYTYTIVDKLPQFVAPEVEAAFVILDNKADTMYYEINGLTAETLSLTHYPSLNLHVYNRKQ